MRAPVLTIFYQFNPWNSTIGGIQTIIKYFIKYAPSEFEIRLVGTGNQQKEATGQWRETELDGRKLMFLPLLNLEDDNIRGRVPTTLKYMATLLGRNFASDFMHFHRLEPTLAAIPWPGDKTLFIHNDIHQQMMSGENKNAILWRYFPQAYFTLERSLVGQFSQILSCNSDSVKHYQQLYPKVAERVAYVRNPVDNEVFYPLSREERNQQRIELAKKLSLPETTRFILFAGRLHPQKDPLLLVRSIAALNEPNVHLLIAGAGELSDQVHSEIGQLGLSQQVSMMGSVDQSSLANLHRLCSVFVLSSAYEGLPLVVLEALACGTPVVTTRCGETPNLLDDDSGVVCKERTPGEIAAALRKVLLNPDNYPTEACVRTAKPYGARHVISEVYGNMLKRWKP
ncbi:MAG: glycosyltransferase family 4 protein [Kovacikia sp.]